MQLTILYWILRLLRQIIDSMQCNWTVLKYYHNVENSLTNIAPHESNVQRDWPKDVTNIAPECIQNIFKQLVDNKTP